MPRRAALRVRGLWSCRGRSEGRAKPVHPFGVGQSDRRPVRVTAESDLVAVAARAPAREQLQPCVDPQPLPLHELGVTLAVTRQLVGDRETFLSEGVEANLPSVLKPGVEVGVFP